MLATNKHQVTLAFKGINQQDFKELQLVVGAYPSLTGLQQRFPGKTLQQQQASEVASIFVFYNTFGRNYILTEFDGTVQIDPVTPPTITLPALPPWNTGFLFDNFEGYSPDGLISPLWGAGIWNNTVGVCQTIIEGIISPFEIFATIFAGGLSKTKALQPQVVGAPSTPATPANPGDPAYLYPPKHRPDISIQYQFGESDNSCTGQGEEFVDFNDIVTLRNFPGGTGLDSIGATSITVGGITVWNNVKIGRTGDVNLGRLAGTCPGPPFPTPAAWDVYPDGTFARIA